MTDRDKKTAFALVCVLLLGSLALWYPKAKQAWTTAQAAFANADKRYQRERLFISREPSLNRQYAKIRETMPVFPEGKSVDTYWLPIMDETARKNHVTIVQRSIGSEEQIGEVTELTLECRDWTGTLDSLVHFLFDLENREDAMLDMRQLYIKPSLKKPGTLQGSFTLNCAYMRQEHSDN